MTFEKIVNYAKQYGFVFQGSEIYGGLANTWDYGPLGVELKNNIKKAWWQKFIQENPYNVGMDAAILMNPTTWEASGHLSGFSDPLTDCRECKTRHRADHLITNKHDVEVDGWSNEDMLNFIKEKEIKCPSCGKASFTDIRQFNLMFKTFQGVTEEKTNVIYLRPETAQGIFVNFLNVQRTMRLKVPFGIGQIGKSFRNEITPGNFIFRTREFEQMELEFFCKPGTEKEWFKYWKDFCYNWLVDLNLKKENIAMRDHSEEELSHYSDATTDIDYQYPFGFEELWGIASRTDYDLKRHQEFSKQSMEYFDPETEKKYIPYVIEPSLGADRMFLAFLSDALCEEQLEKEKRLILKIHPFLAPYKVAVLPLMKKKHSEKAQAIYQQLSANFMVSYDETGNIGKRYRRADAIGTPLAITIDDETLNNNTVTIRDRDTMAQETIAIDEIVAYVQEKIKY